MIMASSTGIICAPYVHAPKIARSMENKNTIELLYTSPISSAPRHNLSMIIANGSSKK